jgi:hypothetical protein
VTPAAVDGDRSDTDRHRKGVGGTSSPAISCRSRHPLVPGDDEAGSGAGDDEAGSGAGDDDFIEPVGLAVGFVVLTGVDRGFGSTGAWADGAGTAPPPFAAYVGARKPPLPGVVGPRSFRVPAKDWSAACFGLAPLDGATGGLNAPPAPPLPAPAGTLPCAGEMVPFPLGMTAWTAMAATAIAAIPPPAARPNRPDSRPRRAPRKSRSPAKRCPNAWPAGP